MKRLVEVSILIEIQDEEVFRAAAVKQAIKDGLHPEDAQEYANEESKSIAECAQMLLDPGLSPDGCNIIDSSSEEAHV